MKPQNDELAKIFLAEARASFDRTLQRILVCLNLLSERDIWWRPNAASNSAGNLVLHLCGNMRQWIVSGLAGELDRRVREAEFAERGPIPRRRLVKALRGTVRDTHRVLRRLSAGALAQNYTIQGFQVTGLVAVAHVYQHFSHHAAQIIYLTKLRKGCDLRLTNLSEGTKRQRPAKRRRFRPKLGW